MHDATIELDRTTTDAPAARNTCLQSIDASASPLSNIMLVGAGLSTRPARWVPYSELRTAVVSAAPRQFFSTPLTVSTATTRWPDWPWSGLSEASWNAGTIHAEPVFAPDIGSSGTRAHWFPETARRINRILQLSADWDTYNAPRIDPQHALAALFFLSLTMAADTPPPSVVPLSDGGVQLEWHRAGVDVEVVFSGSEEDGLYYHDVDTDEEWEGPAREGFSRFRLAHRLQASERAGTL
jgi:hypothetical protein